MTVRDWNTPYTGGTTGSTRQNPELTLCYYGQKDLFEKLVP